MRGALKRFADATVALSFGSTGYRLRAADFDEDDTSVDLTGRVVVITGANAGIGYSTARALAPLGARLLLVCRNLERGERAVRRIREECPSANLELLRCDVSELDDVAVLAKNIQARTPKVDRLILNAGVLLDEREENAAGIERTFATNVLGGFLLMRLLEPQLAAAAPARVLHVTSGGMYTQHIDLQHLQGLGDSYDGVTAYAQTKRAQVILNKLWGERLSSHGVVSHAMHPGWADTPGVATSLPRFRALMRPLLRTPEQGADTLVWLTTAPSIDGRTGELWLDRAPQPTHKTKRTREDDQQRQDLWQLCEGLVAAHLPASVAPSPTPESLTT
jgi:NAD(P)-dependent dehydrogenase (short-subunit alcohol dehydrogenase family)